MIPSDFYVQNVDLNCECNGSTLNLNIVFGCKDNLNKIFNESNWSIMNKSWQQFKLETSINEIDLWDDNTALDKRSLTNARLYPYISLYLDKDEMSSLSQYFWIDLMSSSQKSILVKKWRESSRLSLENVFAMLNYEQLFTRRRRVFNTINVKFLVEHVIENKSIQFNSLIRSAVYDGYANKILKSFDKGNSQLIFF